MCVLLGCERDNGIALVFKGKKDPSRIIGEIKPVFPCPKASYSHGDLFLGDNLGILKGLSTREPETFKLIYLDPPFGTGRLFRFADGSVAFSDQLQGDQYLDFIWTRLVFCHQLLRRDGVLFVHLEPQKAPYIKILLDELFGVKPYQRTIVWKRTNAHSNAKTFANTHDVLFYYPRSSRFDFNRIRRRTPNPSIRERFPLVDHQGNRFSADDLTGESLKTAGNPSYSYFWKGHHRTWRCLRSTMERYESEGRLYYTRTGLPRKKRYHWEGINIAPTDLWDDIPPIHSRSSERLGYPTQKPETLLERIVKSSTSVGDRVLDPFCGSGTILAVSERLKRGWIGIDAERHAIELCQQRLASLSPFQEQQEFSQ